MSIAYESKLIIGWRVKQSDIPDFENRWNDEWKELEPLAQKTSELLGIDIYTDSLCSEEDSWCGNTQMIGVPVFDYELPFGEFEERTAKLAGIAREVFVQVMREEPDDGPYLISYEQVS